jgi:hypothetical protein
VLDVQDDNIDACQKWMLQVGTRTWGPAQSYFGCVPTVLEPRSQDSFGEVIANPIWAACMKENGARLYDAKHVRQHGMCERNVQN